MRHAQQSPSQSDLLYYCKELVVTSEPSTEVAESGDLFEVDGEGPKVFVLL